MMTPERHALIKQIFLDAVACPLDERPELLTRLCGDRNDLRSEVELLLTFHEDPAVATETLEQQATTGSKVPIRPAQGSDLVGTQELAQPPSSIAELAPGTVVADRYRIVSLLGRGGMGVVYRADDLTLHQSIAIKFLRPTLAADPLWLKRFRQEVRLARQVTHPHVCRIFDIGHADGVHFLTMEYLKGGDLATLIQRFGRLNLEKGYELGQQICVGLAAVHAAGILHRDLKPANVMLDEKGRVHITDFGIAGQPQEFSGAHPPAGTPAYASPEQMARQPMTVQSDLYSLGAVLYELFSGQAAFEADSLAQYVHLHETYTPKTLSLAVPNLDPEVEQVVNWCLEKDPESRPSSALVVAAAMPGQDILSAAAAAQLTPSPKMIASANPATERRRRPTAVLVATFILLAITVALRSRVPTPWERPENLSPTVLTERAQEIVRQAGLHHAVKDFTFGFGKAREASSLADDLLGGQASAVLARVQSTDPVFWYRQSRKRLVPGQASNIMLGSARVNLRDPSALGPGMVTVVLDLSGRLLLLAATTGTGPPQQSHPRQVDDTTWQNFFRSAEMRPVARKESEPIDDALNQLTQRTSWRAEDLHAESVSFRVEGGASIGRPALFAVLQGEPDSDTQKQIDGPGRREWLTVTSLRLIFVVVALVALPWAWISLRSEGTDRLGALRLTGFVVVLDLIVWLIRTRHVPLLSVELRGLCLACLDAFGRGALIGIFYIALERFARRHWPHSLIAWHRLLSFRLRDSVVGHHVLAGVCMASFWAFLVAAERALVHGLGWDMRPIFLDDRVLDQFLGGRFALAGYLDALPYAIFRALLFLVLLAVLRAVLRRPVLAAVLAGLLMAPMIVPRGASLLTSLLMLGVGGAASLVWMMLRFGLLTTVVALLCVSTLNMSPITVNPKVWCLDLSLLALTCVGSLAVYGFLAARCKPRPD